MENPKDKKLGSFQADSQNTNTSNISKKTWRSKINPETFPLKVTLFFYYGAMSAILPYLTIHMQEIGISITEIALIYVVLPFTSFLGPPIMGFLADKFGNYKLVLIISTIGTGIFHTSLLLVPSYKSISVSAPVQMQRSLDLGQQLYTELSPHCTSFVHLIENHVSNESAFFTNIENCYNKSDGTIEPPLHLFNLNSSLTDVSKKEYKNTVYMNPTNDSTVHRVVLSVKLDSSTNCFYTITEPKLGVIFDEDSVMDCETNIVYTGKIKEIGNNSTTFWLYFLLRIIATSFATSCFALLDASTLAVVKKCGKAEFGRERIWSILGMGTVSPIAGILVDRISKLKGYTDYAPSFYLADVFLICTVVAILFLKIAVDKSEKGVFKNAIKLAMYPEVVVFLIMVFVLGNLWGFVENYLFVFLKEISAPNYLLGLTLTVGSLVSIPFLWTAEKFVAKVGRVNLIIAAFVFYFIRFYGYSYLQNPFWCFPFEAMEAFTVHLMWTSAATYCSLLAPKGLLASLTGVMGALHYSLGKGSGSFFGGLLYGKVGARLAFRYFGIAGGLFGIVFIILHYTWIRKIVVKRAAEAAIRRKSTISKELQPLSGTQTGVVIENIPNYDGEIAETEDDEDEINSEELEVKQKMLDHCEP